MTTYYAASICAYQDRHDVINNNKTDSFVESSIRIFHTVILIKASSFEEAQKEAMLECKAQYPYAYGYRYHNAVVINTPLTIKKEQPKSRLIPMDDV